MIVIGHTHMLEEACLLVLIHVNFWWFLPQLLNSKVYALWMCILDFFELVTLSQLEVKEWVVEGSSISSVACYFHAWIRCILWTTQKKIAKSKSHYTHGHVMYHNQCSDHNGIQLQNLQTWKHAISWRQDDEIVEY